MRLHCLFLFFSLILVSQKASAEELKTVGGEASTEASELDSSQVSKGSMTQLVSLYEEVDVKAESMLDAAIAIAQTRSGDITEINADFLELQKDLLKINQEASEALSEIRFESLRSTMRGDSGADDSDERSLWVVVRLVQAYTDAMESMGVLKAAMVAYDQDSVSIEWLKGLALRVPADALNYGLGVRPSVGDLEWSKRYTLFVPERDQYSSQNSYIVYLNPHYVSGSARSFSLVTEVSEENLFELAQYLALDRLQQAWSNVQFLLGNDDYSPLEYLNTPEAPIRSRFKDLGLSSVMAEDARRYRDWSYDKAYILELFEKSEPISRSSHSLHKRADVTPLPAYHDEAYFEDVSDILMTDQEYLEEEIRRLQGTAFRSGALSYKKLRYRHFRMLLDYFSVDIENAGEDDFQKALHILLARTQMSADIGSFDEALRQTQREKVVGEDGRLRYMRDEKNTQVKERIYAQGDLYLQRLKDANAMRVTKEELLRNRELQKDRSRLLYSQELLAASRALATTITKHIDMGVYVQVLEPQLKSLRYSPVVEEYLSFLQGYESFRDGEFFYYRVLRLLQSQLDDFVMNYSIAKSDDIKAEEIDVEAAAQEKEELLRKLEAKRKAELAEANVMIFDEQGQRVDPSAILSEHEVEVDSPEARYLKRGEPLEAFATKRLRGLLSATQLARFRSPEFDKRQFEALLSSQLQDLEHWLMVGVILGYHGNDRVPTRGAQWQGQIAEAAAKLRNQDVGRQGRLGDNAYSLLSTQDRREYFRLNQKQLLSRFPVLGLKVQPENKELYLLLEPYANVDPSTVAVSRLITRGLSEVERTIEKAWLRVSEAKGIEDLEHVFLNNPQFKEHIKMAFPEYEHVIEMLSNRMNAPNWYQKYIGTTMESFNSLLVMPLFASSIGRFLIGKKAPLWAHRTFSYVETWRASLTGAFWGLWTSDLLLGSAVMVADSGLGFRMGWENNRPTIRQSQLMEDMDTFFFASPKGATLVSAEYYDDVRKMHRSEVRSAWSHLVLDSILFAFMARGAVLHLRNMQMNHLQGSGR